MSSSPRRWVAGATGSTRSSTASRPTCPGDWRSIRAHRIDGYFTDATYHPTFLYECIWNLGAFGLVIWADQKFKLGYGRVIALYVMAYTAGRGWIEYIRIDTVQLDDVYGLRFNVWTSLVLFVAAAAYFLWSSRRHPGREEEIYQPGRGPDAAGADEPDEAEEAVAEPADAPAEDPADDPAEDPAPDR